MIIREFTSADHDSAYVLWYNTEGVCNCKKCMHHDSRDEIERFLKRNKGLSFVAEESGEIIGTILSGHDGRTGLIYRLVVSEEFRRKGIAGRLVERAVAALKKEGIITVNVSVLNDNEAGNSFWGSVGFNESDTAVSRYKVIKVIDDE